MAYRGFNFRNSLVSATDGAGDVWVEVAGTGDFYQNIGRLHPTTNEKYGYSNWPSGFGVDTPAAGDPRLVGYHLFEQSLTPFTFFRVDLANGDYLVSLAIIRGDDFYAQVWDGEPGEVGSVLLRTISKPYLAGAGFTDAVDVYRGNVAGWVADQVEDEITITQGCLCIQLDDGLYAGGYKAVRGWSHLGITDAAPAIPPVTLELPEALVLRLSMGAGSGAVIEGAGGSVRRRRVSRHLITKLLK